MRPTARTILERHAFGLKRSYILHLQGTAFPAGRSVGAQAALPAHELAGQTGRAAPATIAKGDRAEAARAPIV